MADCIDDRDNEVEDLQSGILVTDTRLRELVEAISPADAAPYRRISSTSTISADR